MSDCHCIWTLLPKIEISEIEVSYVVQILVEAPDSEGVLDCL